jgi:gamma-glutamyltranspeptidase / glutathione hydrolase
MFRATMSFRLAPARSPSVARDAMVASSQQLATFSALEVLRAGGNAVDAALCAAGVLCVTEPHATGIGGDLFAIVRTPDGKLLGLDAAGPAPKSAPPEPPAQNGPRSCDVPGAVAGWQELADRFGTWGLDTCLAPAIDAAERGVVAAAETARNWRLAQPRPSALGRPPSFGQRFYMRELATTLRAIAESGPASFYSGQVADAIVAASWLEHEDLADYRTRWVEPITQTYRGVSVSELPPPTQGVAALEALAIMGDREPTIREEVTAVSLALDDALNHVRDGADVTALLSQEHIESRRAQPAAPVTEPAGGTVYLCVVDGNRTAVSLIQSLYESFGSGVVAGSTGIVLNNRAACFAVNGHVEAGRRPYHTLIPGMLTRGSEVLGPFGVMGGFIQAQAHVQFIVELMRADLDPQAALDRGRFRIDGSTLSLEQPLWESAGELEPLGFKIQRSAERGMFGGGQAIICKDDCLVGGSDARKDGCALGF